MPNTTRPYVPTIWTTGDVITAEKMEHIETGIQAVDTEVVNARTRGQSADNTLGKRIDDLVSISDTQPTSTNNVVWVRNTTSNQVQVPTYEEFQAANIAAEAVSDEVAELKSAIGYDNTIIANIEQYSINTETGKNTSSAYTKYYRTGGFYQPTHIKAVSTKGVLNTHIYFYSSDNTDTFVSSSGGYDNLDTDIEYPTGAKYLRLSGYVKNNPDDPLDLSAVTVTMELPAELADSRVKTLENNVDDLQSHIGQFEDKVIQDSGNLLDADFLLSFDNWAKTGHGDNIVYSGNTNNMLSGYVIKEDFEPDCLYTTSFEAYTDGESVTTGNGFRIYYDYTDGTTLSEYISNDSNVWTKIRLTNRYGMNISKLRIAVASGGLGNTWHIRKFQVTKGNMVEEFIPNKSARDTVLATMVKNIASDVFKTNWWNNGRIRLAMHQGMRSINQPVGNCELSFRTAGINKAWAIETDLRKTNDGYWVCFHDQNVDTLTDGTGNVADLTYAQIRALHYVNQTTGETTDQIISSFEEYLQICKTYNCVPLIEFKFRPTLEDCEAIVGILTNYGIFSYMFIVDIVATSATIRTVTDAPIIQTVTTIDKYNEIVGYVAAACLKNCGIDFEYTLGNSITSSMISDLHQNGMISAVYSSNNAESIKDWFALGMDIVTSDYISDLTT